MPEEPSNAPLVGITIILLAIGGIIGWALKPTQVMEFSWEEVEVRYVKEIVGGTVETYSYEWDRYIVTLYWNEQAGIAYVKIQKLVDLGDII